MKVTMKGLRQLIREAIEECGSSGRYEELEEAYAKEGTYEEGMNYENIVPEGSYKELEEAWSELEEAADLRESKKDKAAKKEKKKKEEKNPAKPAAKEEEAAKKEEKPAQGMMITRDELMAALKLNPHQEKLFVAAIKRGHSIGDALKAATEKSEKKE